MLFEPGQVVVRRHFHRGPVLSSVIPGRVVSDDDRGLLVWVPAGAPLKWIAAVDGRGMRDMPFAEWIATPTCLTSRTWRGSGVLMLMPPGAAHSVWWAWNRPGGEFSGWYVNLEVPLVRWRGRQVAGVDTVDQDLDIVVGPDGDWRWKDEHELAERRAFPEHYWVDDPSAVRAEGERMAKLVDAGAFPFDGTWCDFRPDPSWPVPVLPPGWDRPRVRA
jgi:hypothetical protein